jgi:hypothetical protein
MEGVHLDHEMLQSKGRERNGEPGRACRPKQQSSTKFYLGHPRRLIIRTSPRSYCLILLYPQENPERNRGANAIYAGRFSDDSCA